MENITQDQCEKDWDETRAKVRENIAKNIKILKKFETEFIIQPQNSEISQKIAGKTYKTPLKQTVEMLLGSENAKSPKARAWQHVRNRLDRCVSSILKDGVVTRTKM